MSSQGADLVNVNAQDSLRHPYFVILVLAMVAGAMDAEDFMAFGVFTANQAGNLVFIWVRWQESAAQAWLSIFSLVGFMLGVAVVVLLRRTFPWLATPRGSRALLSLAAVLLGVTAIAGLVFLRGETLANSRELPLFSGEWWAAALSVSSSALALSVLAAVYVKVGAMNASIIASTGPLFDSVRYGTAAVAFRDPEWKRQARLVAGFPLAWTLGAAIAAFLDVNRGVIAAIGAVTIVAIALLGARRVEGAPVTPAS